MVEFSRPEYFPHGLATPGVSCPQSVYIPEALVASPDDFEALRSYVQSVDGPFVAEMLVGADKEEAWEKVRPSTNTDLGTTYDRLLTENDATQIHRLAQEAGLDISYVSSIPEHLHYMANRRSFKVNVSAADLTIAAAVTAPELLSTEAIDEIPEHEQPEPAKKAMRGMHRRPGRLATALIRTVRSA